MTLLTVSRAGAAATGLAVVALMLSGAAHAVDSGTPTTTDPVVCEAGKVYDEEKKECVQAEAGVLDDGRLYEQGRALALAGYYDEALPVLNAIAERDDAMVLTMTGFALRKSGSVADGIALYHQALALEPDNLNTLEYLGEGYVAAGEMKLAVAQLHKLKALCGADCEQYLTLADVIGGRTAWR